MKVLAKISATRWGEMLLGRGGADSGVVVVPAVFCVPVWSVWSCASLNGVIFFGCH